jgi:hypothetical protein
LAFEGLDEKELNGYLVAIDEAKFTKVTYNYYEYLNGYEFLK